VTRRRLLLATLLAGILLGALAAALATGTDRARRHPAAAAAPTPAPLRVGPPRPPEDRLPDGRYSPGYVHIVADRDSLATAPRLGGDPGWAVRTFTGERRTIRGDQRTLEHPRWRQRVRCAELVRTHRDRAGWIFNGHVFRTTTAGASNLLGECEPRTRPAAITRVATVLSFPDPASPVIERVAVYGLAPPATTAVRLNGHPIALARTGGFLALLDPRERGTLTLTFAGPHPHTTRISLRRSNLEARAPDPAGGPGWALPAAHTEKGLPCVGQPGQVAGDRIGAIDVDYGLLTPPYSRCVTGGIGPLTDASPCSIGWGTGWPDNALRDDSAARRARTQRRVSGGHSYLSAVCRADVDRVTIRTPRDIRTLAPTANGHIVFALYDGTFPAGDIIVTTHLRDGATRSQRIGTWP
jgi:hypothetical protein